MAGEAGVSGEVAERFEKGTGRRPCGLDQFSNRPGRSIQSGGQDLDAVRVVLAGVGDLRRLSLRGVHKVHTAWLAADFGIGLGEEVVGWIVCALQVRHEVVVAVRRKGWWSRRSRWESMYSMTTFPGCVRRWCPAFDTPGLDATAGGSQALVRWPAAQPTHVPHAIGEGVQSSSDRRCRHVHTDLPALRPAA